MPYMCCDRNTARRVQAKAKAEGKERMEELEDFRQLLRETEVG